MYTLGVVLQGICVLANGCVLLLNYARYRRRRDTFYLLLCTITGGVVLFWSAAMLFDAGKAFGTW